MDLKKLDYIYFHDASVLKYEKKDNDYTVAGAAGQFAGDYGFCRRHRKPRTV